MFCSFQYTDLTIVSVAINIHVQISVFGDVFISLEYIPKSRIVGLYVNSMFNSLRSCQTSTLPIPFYIPIIKYRSSNFSTPSVIIVIFHFWSLTMVLIYFSLMSNEVGYLFMCLLAICILSLEKCIFKF